jgi:carboxyl-terminal processing protease
MQRVFRISSVAVVLLLLFVFFGSGIAVGRSDGLSSALGAPAWLTSSSQAREEGELDTFFQAWDLVQGRFVDREALDRTELEYAAIRGLLEALGDEGHTRFLTPEELAQHRSDIAGSFSGIGALLGEDQGLPVIVSPFDGSPAELAGLQAGDVIVEVDGQDVGAWSLGDIVDAVRGPEGTRVLLTVRRSSTEANLEVAIVRGEIAVPAVTWTMVPGTDVALVRLSRFSANASQEMATALAGAKASGATALILDVRNNPGGLLEQAVEVTSHFLEEGNVLQEEDAEGRRQTFPVKGGGQATDLPLVVLINEGSASSAEILAGAIQDHRRGTLVGSTTFGTGTVLRTFTLDDGSALMLGTSQWLTANGRLIRKQGIQPDVALPLPSEARQLLPGRIADMIPSEIVDSGDVQVLRALQLLGTWPVSDEGIHRGS